MILTVHYQKNIKGHLGGYKMSKLIQYVDKVANDIQFSGTIHVKSSEGITTKSYGYSNRAERIKNQTNTRYGIASGCKIFTSIAICQLIDAGKLSFDTTLNQCLDVDFPYFDENITVHHLLTHTSGVPDYFDEDEMDDYEELWVSIPMYHIRSLKDFLPLFKNMKMKAEVGSSFSYNNAGYILLGLIVEKVSGYVFGDYIQKYIFQKAGMEDSGYFEMDGLPERTAFGYIEKPNGDWKTNIYSLPVKSASDGGAYVTARDMALFWDALMNNLLLSEDMTDQFLKRRIHVDDDIYYGYAGYMQVMENKTIKHILMGYDPGVNFRFVHYPATSSTIVVCSNKSEGAYEILKKIEDVSV